MSSRVYFRTSRRSGVGVPVWLLPFALILWMCWAVFAVVYYVLLWTWRGVVWMVKGLAWAYASYTQRPPR